MRLEHRGCDSAGIAVIQGGRLEARLRDSVRGDAWRGPHPLGSEMSVNTVSADAMSETALLTGATNSGTDGNELPGTPWHVLWTRSQRRHVVETIAVFYRLGPCGW